MSDWARRQLAIRRPVITEQPLGAPRECERNDCKGCPKITPCRDTFKRSLPARAGD